MVVEHIRRPPDRFGKQNWPAGRFTHTIPINARIPIDKLVEMLDVLRRRQTADRNHPISHHPKHAKDQYQRQSIFGHGPPPAGLPHPMHFSRTSGTRIADVCRPIVCRIGPFGHHHPYPPMPQKVGRVGTGKPCWKQPCRPPGCPTMARMACRRVIFFFWVGLLPAWVAAAPLDVAKLRADAKAGQSAAQTELALRMIHGDGLEKRPTNGFALLHEAAQKGDRHAMTLYGALLTDPAQSQPTADKLAQALAFLEKAARAESSTAFTTLARIHLSRRFAEVREEKKGEQWLVRGIAAGHPGAARLAGRIYLGAGAEAHPKAKLWFTKTLTFYVRYSNQKLNQPSYADQIDLRLAKSEAAAAALSLAKMHVAELADTKKEEAVGWYRTSANLGSVEAMVSLSKIYLKENKPDLAAGMLRRAAEKGHAESMRRLGDCFQEGTGVKRDAAQALHWYEKAIVSGDRLAMVSAARLYHRGDGMAANHRLSFHWAKEAAARKMTDGHYLLGLHHQQGLGTPPNADMAFKSYLRAALGKHPSAMAALSKMYRQGSGIERNDAQAFRWARRSAELGHAEDMDLLGQHLHLGIGVKANPKDAFDWTLQAATMGHPSAMDRVSRFYRQGIGTPVDLQEADRWQQRRKAAP